MAKFVPKARMSRKSLKEMARKKRVTWDFSPVTRKVKSKKLYNRKKRSHDREDDYGMGVFLRLFRIHPLVQTDRKCRKPCPGLRLFFVADSG